MSLVDWIKQFELFSLCHIEIDKNNDQRIIGKLTPGVNAILFTPKMKVSELKRQIREKNLQITLEVTKEQDVWIQTLQEAKNPKESSLITFTLFKAKWMPSKHIDIDKNHRSMRIISPLMSPPIEFDDFHRYEHNGGCYRLTPGKYLMFAAYTVSDARHYIVRVVGKGLSLEMLE